MPAKHFGVIEGGHFQRYEQAFLDAGQCFVHREMTKHLKVLDGQSVAAIVVCNHVRRGGHTLALADGFNHGRTLIANRRGAL